MLLGAKSLVQPGVLATRSPSTFYGRHDCSVSSGTVYCDDTSVFVSTRVSRRALLPKSKVAYGLGLGAFGKWDFPHVTHFRFSGWVLGRFPEIVNPVNVQH